jgi:hypothetical protein
MYKRISLPRALDMQIGRKISKQTNKLARHLTQDNISNSAFSSPCFSSELFFLKKKNNNNNNTHFISRGRRENVEVLTQSPRAAHVHSPAPDLSTRLNEAG